MSFPASTPAFLFLLACGFSVSEGVCPECLSFDDVHLNWCSGYRPITGTDTSTPPGSHSIDLADWTISAELLTPETRPGVETVKVSTSSAAHQNGDTCGICKKKFKNSLELKIHQAKMHKNVTSLNQASTLSTIQALNQPTTTTTRLQPIPETSTIDNQHKHCTTLDNIHTANNTRSMDNIRTLDLNNDKKVHTAEDTRRIQPIRAAQGRQSRPADLKSIDCVCGFKAKNYSGLRAHGRACSVVKRLLIQPSSLARCPHAHARLVTCPQLSPQLSASQLSPQLSASQLSQQLSAYAAHLRINSL